MITHPDNRLPRTERISLALRNSRTSISEHPLTFSRGIEPLSFSVVEYNLRFRSISPPSNPMLHPQIVSKLVQFQHQFNQWFKKFLKERTKRKTRTKWQARKMKSKLHESQRWGTHKKAYLLKFEERTLRSKPRDSKSLQIPSWKTAQNPLKKKNWSTAERGKRSWSCELAGGLWKQAINRGVGERGGSKIGVSDLTVHSGDATL